MGNYAFSLLCLAKQNSYTIFIQFSLIPQIFLLSNTFDISLSYGADKRHICHRKI
jgi:hypothetical protein